MEIIVTVRLGKDKVCRKGKGLGKEWNGLGKVRDRERPRAGLSVYYTVKTIGLL